MGGVCGVHAGSKECVFDLLRGTQRLQHLGQEWSGIAISNKGLITYVVKPNVVREAFPLKDIADINGGFTVKGAFKGSAGIGCTSVGEKQPMCLHSNFGQYALAFDGRILNYDELRKQLGADGHVFYRGNETEVLAKLVAKGKTVVEGIMHLASKVKGSYSIVVLHGDDVYAVRDPFGVNPLQLGQAENKFVVASETNALIRASTKFVREVKPGEIVKLSANGIETVGQILSSKTAFCAFRWFYTARVDSVLEDISSDLVRKEIGAWHFEQDMKDGIKLDFIAGMPMSGTSFALGYSHASIALASKYEYIVPFNEAVLYDRYSGRSYIPPTQEARDRIADEKVSVMEHSVKGKIIGITDDSIVRGTVLMYKIHALKMAGAKEVHVRIGFPMLKDICLLNVSTKTKDELAINKFKSLDGIQKHNGADSLRYTPVDVAVEVLNKAAIKPRSKLTKDDLCMFCAGCGDPTE